MKKINQFLQKQISLQQRKSPGGGDDVARQVLMKLLLEGSNRKMLGEYLNESFIDYVKAIRYTLPRKRAILIHSGAKLREGHPPREYYSLAVDFLDITKSYPYDFPQLLNFFSQYTKEVNEFLEKDILVLLENFKYDELTIGCSSWIKDGKYYEPAEDLTDWPGDYLPYSVLFEKYFLITKRELTKLEKLGFLHKITNK